MDGCLHSSHTGCYRKCSGTKGCREANQFNSSGTFIFISPLGVYLGHCRNVSGLPLDGNDQNNICENSDWT